MKKRKKEGREGKVEGGREKRRVEGGRKAGKKEGKRKEERD